LQILGAALLFSTGGAAIKSCALTTWQVAGFRSAVAVIALLLLMPRPTRWTRRTLAVGLAYMFTMILFVAGNKLTTAANTIFLQSTAPLYMLLIGPVLLDEPVRRRDVSFMLVLAAGLGMFFIGTEPALATAPNPTRGNVFAALSGVSWALTVAGLRWVSRDADDPGTAASSALIAGNALTFVVCLPLALPLSPGSAADWAVVAYLGSFQVGVAYVLLSTGVRRVPALESSLLLLLEPVLNPVWAWVVHGETPGAWSLVGGLTILAATAAKTLLDGRSSGRSLANHDH